VHTAQAEAQRAHTQQRHRAAEKSWQEQETSLDYARDILPGLNRVRLRDIALTLGVSKGYASAIRQGTRTPHPRHWEKLAVLANASLNS
jgi:hypothetical protein